MFQTATAQFIVAWQADKAQQQPSKAFVIICGCICKFAACCSMPEALSRGLCHCRTGERAVTPYYRTLQGRGALQEFMESLGDTSWHQGSHGSHGSTLSFSALSLSLSLFRPVRA